MLPFEEAAILLFGCLLWRHLLSKTKQSLNTTLVTYLSLIAVARDDDWFCPRHWNLKAAASNYRFPQHVSQIHLHVPLILHFGLPSPCASAGLAHESLFHPCGLPPHGQWSRFSFFRLLDLILLARLSPRNFLFVTVFPDWGSWPSIRNRQDRYYHPHIKT